MTNNPKRLTKIAKPESLPGWMVQELRGSYWDSIGCILDNGADGDARRRYFLSVGRAGSSHRTLAGAMAKCGARYVVEA